MKRIKVCRRCTYLLMKGFHDSEDGDWAIGGAAANEEQAHFYEMKTLPLCRHTDLPERYTLMLPRWW